MFALDSIHASVFGVLEAFRRRVVMNWKEKSIYYITVDQFFPPNVTFSYEKSNINVRLRSRVKFPSRYKLRPFVKLRSRMKWIKINQFKKKINSLYIWHIERPTLSTCDMFGTYFVLLVYIRNKNWQSFGSNIKPCY